MSTNPDDADRVGLVIALPTEAHSMGVHGLRAGDCRRWRNGWVAVSGVGAHNAMRAAGQLVSHGVSQLANWGVAGALDPSLVPGDVVLPDRVIYSTQDDGYAADPALHARVAAALGGELPIHCGTLWSAIEVATSREEKRRLAASSHALAIDMEAAPVAAVAQRASLPFVAVKVICDAAGRDLPEGIASTLDQSENGMSLRMLVAIALGGPRAWLATRRLARDFARARRALARAARIADPMIVAP